jgi:ABC-type glycerol-3-phosphate transport system permease component
MVALGLLVAASAFPFYWAILGSFTPEARLFENPSLLPRELMRITTAPSSPSGTSAAGPQLLIVAGSPRLLRDRRGLCAPRWPGSLSRQGPAARGHPCGRCFQISVVSPYLQLRSLAHQHLSGLVLPYLTFAMPLTIWLWSASSARFRRAEEAAMVDGRAGYAASGR